MKFPLVFPIGNTSFLVKNQETIEVETTSPSHFSGLTKVILICHPHPLRGGTMHNKVVTTLVKTFDEQGYYTVRFNFRGVGKSEGVHAEGLGETDDAVFLLDWITQVLPDADIYLAGFSFGAYVAYRVATITRYSDKIKHLYLVAPPVFYPEFIGLPSPCMPWTVIQGDEDEIVNAADVLTWAEEKTNKPTILYFKKTTHFFHGKLIELKQRIQESLI